MASSSGSELDATLRQLDGLGARTAGWNQASERIVAIGASGLAIFGAVAAANDYYWALVAVPLIFAMLASLGTYVNAEVNALGGYQAALEQHANELIGAEVYQWESKLGPSRHSDLPSRIFVGLLVLIQVLSLVLGFWAAGRLAADDPSLTWVLWAMGVVALISVAVLFAAARGGERVRDRYRDRALAALGHAKRAHD